MKGNLAELFPASPRVIYSKTPLVQVICELRFPLLLSIEGQPPVAFQEQVRGHFPLLEKKPATAFPAEIPSEIVQMIRPHVEGGPSYVFLTADRASTVTLTPGSLALSTKRYTRWEDFRDQLRVPLEALNQIYRPSFFSRIGLRYQDAIDRAALGLKSRSWSELLRRELLGELALPQFEAHVEQVANRTLRVGIPGGSGSVMLRHGLGKLPGRDEICYMIDIDIFTEQRTEVADAESTLNHFNAVAGHAFRWCVLAPLRDELGPNELAAAAV
jgi:uncharacterized protein (TIGR04255 family)